MATSDRPAEQYDPPKGSEILASQDSVNALRLLIAQRKLYSLAKKWLGLRLVGMWLVGIAAPVATLLWPEESVAIGAVAALWLFFGRTTFILLEKKLSSKAAAVQELFDLEIFAMPSLGERSPGPTLEEITSLAGPDEKIMAVAKSEKLLGWYEVSPNDDGTTSVAICQRSNVAYSASLFGTAARVWFGVIILWVALLITLSIWLEFSLGTFLLGVALPLLPAFLDTFKYWQEIRRASADRSVLSRDIETKIQAGDVSGEDLLVWQTKMYELRRDAPQVPNFIYGLMRKRNERIMKSVAAQLSDKAGRTGSPS